jgi:hypothetical protein
MEARRRYVHQKIKEGVDLEELVIPDDDVFLANEEHIRDCIANLYTDV